MQTAPALMLAVSGVAAAAVAWLIATGRIPGPLAHPEARSLHVKPVPRVGGIAIWTGWMACWAVAPVSALWLLPLALVVLVSLVDDYRGLLPRVRILVHIGAAIPVASLWLGATGILLVFEVLVIVWMANLYNFMDGADGMAGAMGVAGFGAYALAAVHSGHAGLGILNGGLALACAGFLIFNLPPARVFMGDVGAVGLGFAAGIFGLKGWVDAAWPWWFAPLVFAPFIADASATLLRRMHGRAPIAQSHRDHFYQRSIIKDGRHGPTVAAYAAWMAIAALFALAGLRWAPDAGPVLLLLMLTGFGGYCWSIERRTSSTTRGIQDAG